MRSKEGRKKKKKPQHPPRWKPFCSSGKVRHREKADAVIYDMAHYWVGGWVGGCNTQKAFNLEGLRSNLDAQASGIGDYQDASTESRKNLAEATKSTQPHGTLVSSAKIVSVQSSVAWPQK